MPDCCLNLLCLPPRTYAPLAVGGFQGGHGNTALILGAVPAPLVDDTNMGTPGGEVMTCSQWTAAACYQHTTDQGKFWGPMAVAAEVCQSSEQPQTGVRQRPASAAVRCP